MSATLGPVGSLQHLAHRRTAGSSDQAADLATLAGTVDERRYVCPDALDRRLDQLLDDVGDSRLLLLSGSGGSGKSAALREAARRGERLGYHVVALDGRHMTAAGVRLTDLLGDLPDRELLILIDELGHLGARAQALGRVLASLPGSTRVVTAAPTHPEGWVPTELTPLVASLRMPALDTEVSEEVLRRHGVTDPEACAVITAWACGLPLALVLGAAAWVEHGAAAIEPGGAVLAATAGDLVGQVSGLALDQLDGELLEVAAVAGWVDEALLTDVLPERDGQSLLATLASYSFVERSGSGLTLHPLVAHAVAERVRHDGMQVPGLVLRIASHLRDRARAGDTRALHQLAGLSEDPRLRAGMAPAPTATLYGDDVRPNEADQIGRWLPSGLADAVRPWLQPPTAESWRSPAQVVRHTDGRLLAVALAMPLSEAAALVRTDDARAELIAPLLAWAEEQGIADRVVLSPFQLLAPGAAEEDPNVVPLRNGLALRRCRVPNPRFDLVNEFGWSDGDRAIMTDCGYVEVPELRRTVGGEEVRTWFADVGPCGLVGLVFRSIAAEHGIDLPEPRTQGDLVLAALDDFHDDACLAGLPCAPLGHDIGHAADRVRTWVRRAMLAALHDQPDLARLLEQRYLEPAATHDQVMRTTFLSRATYFRRIRTARELVAAAADRVSAPV
ncbi:hypothetical protein F0U44_09000 [Nocardioides humilatus]|uniref:Uncharacterized protein n=1 Tax=Nocardioides humilatus TaxID=2607660 RepID=A0A5B1LG61_9ACTN|nr:hypothetical protein [Nocardioides humilatus]KAA1418627.1 hypothetical protein F0U44_09000 [Nocardioides humilatus]